MKDKSDFFVKLNGIQLIRINLHHIKSNKINE